MKSSKYILFLSLLWLCLGCSLTRNLEEGKFVVYDNVLLGINKADEDALQQLLEQEPNTRILGSSFGVSLFRLGEHFFDSSKIAKKRLQTYEQLRELQQTKESQGEALSYKRKEEKLRNKLESFDIILEYGNAFMRTGNPAVLLDSMLVEKSAKNMKGYLINHGFFDAKVNYNVATKNKKAFVTYRIDESDAYVLDSVLTRTDNPEIKKLLTTYSANAFLKKGQIYNQDNIAAERNRLEELLKNKGYYMFSKSYVNYIAYQDTSSKTIRLEQVIQKPTFSESHRVYTLDTIRLRINPPTDEFADRQIQTHYEGVDFSFYRDRYSAKTLASRIQMKKGSPYNRTDALETQRLINSLDLFRFVNITFDTLGTSLTASIFTQPNQKYQLTNQLGMTITEQLPGPFFSTAIRNRNLFRAGEVLELNFRAGLEGVASATGQGVYQSSEVNTSVSVIFPRFLIPFAPSSLQKYGKYNPNTRVQFGYLSTNRPEYNRNAINGQLGYTWSTRNNRQSFTVNAADISYIRTPFIQDEFLTILENLQTNGNNLIWSFLPSLISSFSGQTLINFNRYGDFSARKASLLRIFGESGGTTLNFTNVRRNDSPEISYANFQWLKGQIDYRRYYPISKKQTLAYRLNFGMARPYGVSAGILPYEKYFFAGGGTSIRAWQARRLGPGSYTPLTGSGGSYDYTNEQPAEMILESMLEYRKKLVSYFDMALFLDAGNSWMIGRDDARPGADFRYDRFYKEIAIGTGIGLRMDFDFLVIRLDLATKAVDPARPEGERWILDNLRFNKPFGEKGQTVFNFGIGYPF
uniref:translocation and assembly module lipoprotein TamL n=1 Tax=Algoriphagus sp. TaxID=1872435 RepID=UPI0040481798